MAKDIETRADVELLVTEFYSVAIPDSLIGHHFATLDMRSHIPVMVDFWEKTILGNPVYFGNPLIAHQTRSKDDDRRGQQQQL